MPLNKQANVDFTQIILQLPILQQIVLFPSLDNLNFTALIKVATTSCFFVRLWLHENKHSEVLNNILDDPCILCFSVVKTVHDDIDASIYGRKEGFQIVFHNCPRYIENLNDKTWRTGQTQIPKKSLSNSGLD